MLYDALFPTTRTVPEVLHTILTYVCPYQSYACSSAVACMVAWALLRWLHAFPQQHRTTQLRGPPSESFLYGVGKDILDAKDAGAVYEMWAQQYGPVYAVPSTLGSKRIVLCDPKALAHFYSKDTWSYSQTSFARVIIRNVFGKGLSWAHGEDHKRQRRSLTPAFSLAAIRQLTPIFSDTAYKAKWIWDGLIESSDGDSTIIEVQNWMSHISFDVIGLAGYSHNFGALESKHVYVTEVFDAFNMSSTTATIDNGLFLLGLIFPLAARAPTSRTKLLHKLNIALAEIPSALLSRTRKEMEAGVVGNEEERSIIGLLIKGMQADSEFHLTKDEVMAQMKTLLFAGYETTSVILTWALIELSRNLDVQTKLRIELLEHGADPTFDQLTTSLPYLDAVVHEILRLHPPVPELTRVATNDDVIPLSEPVRTKSGELVNSLEIAKGTLVAIPIESINCSASLWGEDAKVFRPDRWLEDPDGQDGIPAKAKDIQGHRHLLTFWDGPRVCLGKNFALAEVKVVLTVLVKNFVFEPRDGLSFKVDMERGLLPRPKIAGEVGPKVPLRVRPYVA